MDWGRNMQPELDTGLALNYIMGLCKRLCDASEESDLAIVRTALKSIKNLQKLQAVPVPCTAPF